MLLLCCPRAEQRDLIALIKGSQHHHTYPLPVTSITALLETPTSISGGDSHGYTIFTKVCGHPFKLVDLAISATPVADRCIKSSTQQCNLHRQTLAVEWRY